MLQNDDLSRAIVLSVGYGTEMHPKTNFERVKFSMGADAADKLLPLVEEILSELNDLKPDWDTMSLGEIYHWVRNEMHGRHPDLTSQSLDALGWAYTYWWR